MKSIEFHRSILFLFLAALTLSGVACKPTYRHHDPDKAATVAAVFARTAFIVRDFEKSFAYTMSNRFEGFDAGKLKESVENIHPSGQYPNDINAKEYEIVPNSGVIFVYLQGKGSNGEAYHYRIVTVPENNDYKIAEFYRAVNPYQKTPAMRSLE